MIHRPNKTYVHEIGGLLRSCLHHDLLDGQVSEKRARRCHKAVELGSRAYDLRNGKIEQIQPLSQNVHCTSHLQQTSRRQRQGKTKTKHRTHSPYLDLDWRMSGRRCSRNPQHCLAPSTQSLQDSQTSVELSVSIRPNSLLHHTDEFCCRIVQMSQLTAFKDV